jgi:type II secretory pathway component GspD/PulD (secretin)
VTRSEPNEQRVTLTADEQTNRILAFGPAHLLEQLGALVADLDRRHGQILVEAMVVALNDRGARDLGVELRKIGTAGDGQYSVASLFGLGSASGAATELPALGGSGFSGAVLDPGDFSALVRALEVVNRGRSLTMPKVLVTNNQEATLDSVLQTPFASTNASQTVATTSFGGTQDAGTSIRVKPQVASGELVVLDYSVSISSFIGDAPDPALPPPRQQTCCAASSRSQTGTRSSSVGSRSRPTPTPSRGCRSSGAFRWSGRSSRTARARRTARASSCSCAAA